MIAEDIPVQQIADLFERDPDEIEQAYLAWLALRKGRDGAPVPDIKLLASLSGLSTASVSNFLRSKPGAVSETKAQRLAELVELLGYVPSSAAQSLRGRHTDTIGIAVPLSGISPDFYLEILSGIKQEADILGFQQFIFNVTSVEARVEFFSNMPFLGIVDGLIAIGLHISESRLRILNRHALPVVAVHNRLTDPPVVANVLGSNENVLQELIDRHLIKHHQYRRLALVTLNAGNPLKMGDSGSEDWSRIGRINAYKDALGQNEIEYRENLVFEVDQHTFEEGYRAFDWFCQMNQALPAGEQIQAIVCTSDTLAAGILTAARRNGIDIPVIGFDNLPLAELLSITTVDQRATEVGRLAFRHLYNAMAYHKRKKEFPPSVEEGVRMHAVIRNSCGCPN